MRADSTNSPTATCRASCWPGSVRRRSGPKAASWCFGRSLAEFMRQLGMKDRQRQPSWRSDTNARIKCERLFSSSTVAIIYVTDSSRELADQFFRGGSHMIFGGTSGGLVLPYCGRASCELGEQFFQGDHPPANPTRPEPPARSIKRSSLGLDLYLWLNYRNLCPYRSPLQARLAAALPPVRRASDQSARISEQSVKILPPSIGPPGVEKDQDRMAGSELRHGQGSADPLS